MTNVVHLPAPPPRVVMCGCGSQEFFLVEGGTVVCVGCRMGIETHAWHRIAPNRPSKAVNAPQSEGKP